MTIGAIADTHGLLRAEALKYLADCDAILHAGDVGKAQVLKELARIAPVYAVRGNNDAGEWAMALPAARTVSLGGVRFFIAHARAQIPPDCAAAVRLYGHSHAYRLERDGDVLYLNPGSCGPRRFGSVPTLARLRVEDGAVRV